MNRLYRSLSALALLGLAALPLSCASGRASTGSTGTPGSGIEGHTMVDAGCPMVRQDTPCPDRPLSARITVTGADSSAVIATTVSGADGHFSLPLPPGTYVLHPANLTGAVVPIAQPTTVTVHPARYTSLTIPFDSGVR